MPEGQDAVGLTEDILTAPMSTDLDPFEHADAAAGPETSPDWIFARAAARDDQRVLLSSQRRLGEHVARMYPNKEEMAAGGLEALLEGYLPKEPLINEETNVIALGSCFAALFVQWLAEKGFNRQFAAAPDASFVWSRLETPVVVAQQFRWAFAEFDPDLAFWFGPGQQPYEATEARREQLRSLLVESDVAILTLGLTESWYDVESGEAIWRVPPPEVATDRYRFKVGSVAESVTALETIERLRCEHMPSTKFILTTSPVRFGATFRPISPVVANVASKAGVRASLDEFLRAHEDLVGEVYHYFPSYEMVTELFMIRSATTAIHIGTSPTRSSLCSRGTTRRCLRNYSPRSPQCETNFTPPTRSFVERTSSSRRLIESVST